MVRGFEFSEASPLEQGDRLVIRLDPGGPVELSGLTESFSAIARLYARHYRIGSDDAAPKLFITKLESGSIVAEIAPFVVSFGQPLYQFVAAANTIAGFSKRLSDGLRAFAGIEGSAAAPRLPASQDIDDAADLREFVKPLMGRRGATLAIKHARFRQTDGQRETVVEYDFDEQEINRAAINIDRALDDSLAPKLLEIASAPQSSFKQEVLLYFDRASRAPGKERGRATDWTIVPDVSDKALPTYFRQSVRGNLKDVMVRGKQNPLTDTAFIVDVHVQLIDGVPKAYIVTEFHDVVPLPDNPDT